MIYQGFGNLDGITTFLTILFTGAFFSTYILLVYNNAGGINNVRFTSNDFERYV
jgi:hypothetical protein